MVYCTVLLRSVSYATTLPCHVILRHASLHPSYYTVSLSTALCRNVLYLLFRHCQYQWPSSELECPLSSGVTSATFPILPAQTEVLESGFFAKQSSWSQKTQKYTAAGSKSFRLQLFLQSPVWHRSKASRLQRALQCISSRCTPVSRP